MNTALLLLSLEMVKKQRWGSGRVVSNSWYVSFTKCPLPHAGSVLQLQGAQIATYYCDTLNEQGHLAVCLTRFPSILAKLVLMVAIYSIWANWGTSVPLLAWCLQRDFSGTPAGRLGLSCGLGCKQQPKATGSTAVCSWGLQGFPPHPKPLLMWLQEKPPQPTYGTSAFLLAQSRLWKKVHIQAWKEQQLGQALCILGLATVHAPPGTMWWCPIWYSWKVVESLRGGC